ncbi:hypothetical protein MKS88_003947 [Plasmodium brasilianum]|uniref:Uncharacterized protein n=1 Tax=Plasmodium brasilianum TaxID=5824 RepID=A0ACB9Y992_PLABR|nr:hypothetical protein MKS88_003947 [Plasmodium brasilianum]
MAFIGNNKNTNASNGINASMEESKIGGNLNNKFNLYTKIFAFSVLVLVLQCFNNECSFKGYGNEMNLGKINRGQRILSDLYGIGGKFYEDQERQRVGVLHSGYGDENISYNNRTNGLGTVVGNDGSTTSLDDSNLSLDSTIFEGANNGNTRVGATMTTADSTESLDAPTVDNAYEASEYEDKFMNNCRQSKQGNKYKNLLTKFKKDHRYAALLILGFLCLTGCPIVVPAIIIYAMFLLSRYIIKKVA